LQAQKKMIQIGQDLIDNEKTEKARMRELLQSVSAVIVLRSEMRESYYWMETENEQTPMNRILRWRIDLPPGSNDFWHTSVYLFGYYYVLCFSGLRFTF
jgi:hypothetical protein